MLRKNVSNQYVFFSLVKAADGTALTGATVTGYRSLDNAAQAAVTGSFTEQGNGQYRFNPSQADTNANFAGYLFTATNAVPVQFNFITTGGDFSDSVRFGLTALPNAAAAATGGLLTSGTGANQITTSSGQVTVSANNDKTGYALSTGGVQAIWNALTSAMTVDFSIGKWIYDRMDDNISSRATASQATSISSAVSTVGTNVLAIKAKTDNLPASPAAVGSAMTLATDSVNAAALATDAVTEIVNGVWNEAQSGHTSAGTFGKYLDQQVSTVSAGGSVPTAAEIADAVWDEAQSGHTTAGSFGKRLDKDVSAVASDVWDQVQFGHTTAGTFGKYLDAQVSGVSGGSGGSSAADIADAVWDEARAGHTAAGSFGQGVASVQGNVTGSTASVTGPVSVAAASIKAIWDYVTSALTVEGSIGKWILDKLDDNVSSRAHTNDVSNVATQVSNLDAKVTLVKAKTDTIPTNPAAAGDAMRLLSSSVTAAALASDAANKVADAVLDRADGIETGWSLRKTLRIVFSVLAGKVTGAGTTLVKFRDVNDTKDRVEAAVNSTGNRTTVNLDGE